MLEAKRCRGRGDADGEKTPDLQRMNRCRSSFLNSRLQTKRWFLHCADRALSFKRGSDESLRKH